MNINDPYSCPKCGASALDFDGTYYRIDEKGEVHFDLSSWDLEETNTTLPENYYPKFGVSTPTCGEFAGLGYDWDETHKCPECGTVFTFINGSV